MEMAIEIKVNYLRGLRHDIDSDLLFDRDEVECDYFRVKKRQCEEFSH